MINYLKGTITRKFPTEIILDVNGVGFDIHVLVLCEVVPDINSDFKSVGPAM